MKSLREWLKFKKGNIMKTTKLNVALAISFAAILAVSGYVGYTGETADDVNC